MLQADLAEIFNEG